jgi:hypothetical protein
MSRIRRHRTVPAVVVLVAATGLAVAGSSVASAHPASDVGTCEESLARAVSTVGDLVIFSDAHYSYLLRQPPCDGWQSARP